MVWSATPLGAVQRAARVMQPPAGVVQLSVGAMRGLRRVMQLATRVAGGPATLCRRPMRFDGGRRAPSRRRGDRCVRPDASIGGAGWPCDRPGVSITRTGASIGGLDAMRRGADSSGVRPATLSCRAHGLRTRRGASNARRRGFAGCPGPWCSCQRAACIGQRAACNGRREACDRCGRSTRRRCRPRGRTRAFYRCPRSMAGAVRRLVCRNR